MSAYRPFREVKLQWLQQLSCDKDLSDNARSIALYIVTTHMNGHTEKAWPSYQTIADATGKSVKTIQRAIRELEDKEWFDVRRGNGIGHNTEYSPSAFSILRACEAREKTDRIVTLRAGQGGQIRPQRQSDMSGKGGQICPPNPEKEKIYIPNAREERSITGNQQPAVPAIFVADTKIEQLHQWQKWLGSRGLGTLDTLSVRATANGKTGYLLPGHWPPAESGPNSGSWTSFFSRRRDGAPASREGTIDAQSRESELRPIRSRAIGAL
ncbi:MAG: helix-turn-helix domain-containing protein [Alphaproteobacteria bacterium]|uniref:helix-turn-helix domain-containing protein n=1 Tax=unclassified Agrobacterium TaxID=2632611 RepID=UPI0008576876|nr:MULTISPECIES: helix-turn-helix domain-containing protein [unclassified Agrobacterium]MBU0737391.1 helix-turn-helix domain-containing protein [Alphaproteobacteria bacterium]AOG10469.1 helix-turn-helix domain protein [Agrobacterium sp. RAC06]MBU0833738.1 helix-turn-helix domain-containing protein [Alphaproteobacteria bacterium]MBU1765980.1 helix-turn-helix domain-containing protein [Alphaproteobacteria bacterium]QGG91073.1 helix-turn-helix domain-containing protein [Agrobacterium sp. MA01]